VDLHFALDGVVILAAVCAVELAAFLDHFLVVLCWHRLFKISAVGRSATLSFCHSLFPCNRQPLAPSPFVGKAV
jgi:hypothetical protein